MNYFKEFEMPISDLIEKIEAREKELDPNETGQDDLLNALHELKTDLKNAANMIEKIKERENYLKPKTVKTYVTFGQVHVHRVNGKTFDKDCVAVIEAENATKGREKAFEYFGLKFFTTYIESEWKKEDMEFFPRGYIYL